MRSDLERLRDILEAIEAIEKYCQKGRAKFDGDELIRTWCLKHIEIIGEAAARLAEPFRQQYPHIPWRAIIGMRNVLVHGYFQVDWNEVWVAIEKDLPMLKSAVKNILQK